MVSRRILPGFLFSAACTVGQPVRKQDPRYSDKDLENLEKELLDSVNRRRRNASVAPLVWSDLLATQARRHSLAMLEGGFFSHLDPVRGGLERRLDEPGGAKIPWRRVAENLFQGQSLRDPVAATVESWMKSSGHRRNLMDATYTESGAGFAIARGGAWYATEIFAWLAPDEAKR